MSTTLVRFKAPLPEFVRVTICAALVVPTGSLKKPKLVGERLTAAAVPVPERFTVSGLPVALPRY